LTSKKEQFYIQRISELEAHLKHRDERIVKLEKEVAELKQTIHHLTEQIAKLSKNSSNSSKPPSSDIVKPPKDNRSKKRHRQGGQPGHPGVNRQPFTSDQIDQTLEVPAGACDCGCRCRGKKLDQVRIHQFAELRDDPLIVTEYRLHGYVCPRCGQSVWAKLPEGVIEGQLFGPRLQALIGYMKGSLHASYSGLEAFCREVLNINVARSHLCNVIKRVNEALATPYEELKEHIPTEPVLNIDETGWKDKSIKYWAWVFCSPRVSFFWIAKSRSSKVLKEILGETYDGTIVSDFFSAYVKYANKLQQFCLAHLIRDIKFLITLPDKNDRDFGNALLKQFKKLFHFWHQRDKIPKDQFDRRMLQIKKRVFALAEQDDLLAKSATLAKRIRKHGDAIFRFMFDPAVPPTNNGGEQSIRQLVIDRRITQGSRSPMGRQWNARIWTVLDTCRKQGRSAWQFLQNALSAYYFQSPTPSLLPQA
jgi:transposase